MNNDLVSIIIPTKNRIEATKRALKSCLSQTHTNIEIIIVDDGSNIDQRLSEWIDTIKLDEKQVVKAIQLEVSKGGGYARNAGVEACKGDYVTFLDSDDIYLNNNIEEQLSENKKHSCDVITYGKAIRTIFRDNYIIKELDTLPKFGMEIGESVGTYLFCNNGRLFTPSLFMRKEVFNQIKFDVHLKRHQDYGFVLKAESLKIPFVFINKPLFRWISDENSESSSYKKISLDVSIVFMNRYKLYLTNNEIKAYLFKVAAPIALKNRNFLTYYKLVKKSMGKNYKRFVLKSLFWGTIYKVIAYIRFHF